MVNHFKANRLMMVEHHGFLVQTLFSGHPEITGGTETGERLGAGYSDFQNALESANHKLLGQSLKGFRSECKG